MWLHGVVRRTSNLTRSRIEHLRRDEAVYERRLFLHYGDLSAARPFAESLLRRAPARSIILRGRAMSD